MHLMILDPHQKGHYLAYVKNLLSEANRIVDRVTLILRRDAPEQPEFTANIVPFTHGAEIIPCIRNDSYRVRSQLLADVDAAIRSARPDHVWAPSGDKLVQAAGIAALRGGWRLPPGVEAECGLIEINFHYPPPRLRGYASKFAWRLWAGRGPWSKLHTIDPTLTMWLRYKTHPLRNRIGLVPDPIEPCLRMSSAQARQRLGIPTEGRYIGTAGATLSVPRKGSLKLVNAFVHAKLGADVRLLVAGELGNDLRLALEREYSSHVHKDRIVVVDRYLSDDDFSTAISAMDLVCTPYVSHMGSSGVALRAAQLGRPILAPRQGWFAAMVAAFELGTTFDPTGVESLADALPAALDGSRLYETSPACGRLMEYSSADNFALHWSQILRQRLGMPEAPGMRTWDWVVGGSRN